MTDKMPEPEIEVIYLGPVTLSDKKKGSLFITPELLAQQPDFKAAWEAASPFSATKGLVVGGRYSSNGTIEDGRVRRLGLKSLRIRGRVEHSSLVEFELRKAAQDEEDKRASLDRKLKAEPRLMQEVEQLGAFLARVPWGNAYAAECAIIQAIRDAARKAGRR